MARKRDKATIVAKRTMAMRCFPGPLLLSLALAAAAVYTLIELSSLRQAAGAEPQLVPAVAGLAWPWFAGAAVLVLLPWLQVFWRSRMSRYRVYTDRLVETHGLLGRQEVTARIADVREVLVRRTFGQRLLGVGDVVVLGSEGPSVQFRGVASPSAVAHLIEELRAGRLPGDVRESSESAAALPPAEKVGVPGASDRAPAPRAERSPPKRAARPAAKPAARPAASDDDARAELWRLLEEQANEEGKGS